MLKKIGVVVLVAIVFLLVLLFTYSNPGQVELDLWFREIQTSIPIAFTTTFIFGWIFGLVSTGIFIIRLVNERRQLRKALRIAESEVSSLRNLPIADAD